MLQKVTPKCAAKYLMLWHSAHIRMPLLWVSHNIHAKQKCILARTACLLKLCIYICWLILFINSSILKANNAALTTIWILNWVTETDWSSHQPDCLIFPMINKNSSLKNDAKIKVRQKHTHNWQSIPHNTLWYHLISIQEKKPPCMKNCKHRLREMPRIWQTIQG